MPCDYADYHPDWKSIRRQILDQADDKCEFCGVPNHAWIQRNVRGEWMLYEELSGWNSDAGWHWIGSYDIEPVDIVLTVAHLCHEPACYDPTHLRALCQKCHNAYDAPMRRTNAAATRERKKREAIAATGQIEMLPLA